MLTNFKEMLWDAYKGHYAVGSFNAYSYDTFKGIIEANRKAGNRPTIAAFGAKYLSNMSLDDAFAMVESIGKSAPDMQICLHLDHCKDFDIICQAIRAGFGSVMYDGSALPFEENLKNTARVCEIAHACGVSVEAELGSLAAGQYSHEGEATDEEIYTDPEKAAEFIASTGVDALAVSVGTVHGLYKGTPKVRVDILQKINEAAKIPLVLHGGSGIPEDIISSCIKNGITKINVNTEISVFAGNKLKERLMAADKIPHLSVLALDQQKDVEEVVSKYISFFGATD
ncbi:MAG: class II fructose-bisphosphate aldolase [Lachnospiraceae bacterium]|nr:class II fructose-bisphosphate aldolase [Lachnospiraceae bacterium]